MEETIYSVSQAAGLLEVQSHVLRYWEDELALPIGRNEMGHRYYTRWDIQVFLSIKELKKKGYSLKELRELTSLFYNRVKKDKDLEEKVEKVPSEFLEIISRIVVERVREKSSGEDRFKRLDERIRSCQQSRREVAAAAEKKNAKRKIFHKK